MTVSEFLRWEAYDTISPIGFVDLHFGRLMQLLASIYSKKGHEPKLKDFLIGEWPENIASIEEMEQKMDQLIAMGGGSDED